MKSDPLGVLAVSAVVPPAAVRASIASRSLSLSGTSLLRLYPVRAVYVPPEIATADTVAATVSVRSTSETLMESLTVREALDSVTAAVSGANVITGVSLVPVIVIVINWLTLLLAGSLTSKYPLRVIVSPSRRKSRSAFVVM